MSLLAPSAIVTAPSVVHAGDAALAAVSAEMLLPPAAGATVTLAKTPPVPARTKAKTGINLVKARLPNFNKIIILGVSAFTGCCNWPNAIAITVPSDEALGVPPSPNPRLLPRHSRNKLTSQKLITLRHL